MYKRVGNSAIFFQNSVVTINKAFVGLRSCDNVQTERKIFKYANWPRLQIKRTGLSSWSVQLVRPAGPSSWSVKLVRLAGHLSCYLKLILLAGSFSWSFKEYNKYAVCCETIGCNVDINLKFGFGGSYCLSFFYEWAMLTSILNLV